MCHEAEIIDWYAHVCSVKMNQYSSNIGLIRDSVVSPFDCTILFGNE